MTATVQVPLSVDPALIAEYVAQVVREQLDARNWGVPRLALSITEAADALSISRAAAYRLVKAGELPTITIGPKKVVSVAALEQFVAALTQAAAA